MHMIWWFGSLFIIYVVVMLHGMVVIWQGKNGGQSVSSLHTLLLNDNQSINILESWLAWGGTSDLPSCNTFLLIFPFTSMLVHNLLQFMTFLYDLDLSTRLCNTPVLKHLPFNFSLASCVHCASVKHDRDGESEDKMADDKNVAVWTMYSCIFISVVLCLLAVKKHPDTRLSMGK